MTLRFLTLLVTTFSVCSSAFAQTPGAINESSTTRWNVRTYTSYFRSLDRTNPNNIERSSESLERLRARIGNDLLVETPEGLALKSRNNAFDYILESVLEGAFHPGMFRDSSVSLVSDYKRYLAATMVRSILQKMKYPQLPFDATWDEFKNALVSISQPYKNDYAAVCAKVPDVSHYECLESIRFLLTFPHQSQGKRVEHFLPGAETSCMGSTTLANIKLGFLLDAMIKRGRVVPVSPALRNQMGENPSKYEWIMKSKANTETGRLLKNAPHYQLLGLYQCHPDAKNKSGKIYIDITMNPYDMATFLLHELNHFAADKFATSKQIQLMKTLSADEINYLEDVGSFGLSSLAQIDLTLRVQNELLWGQKGLYALLPQALRGSVLEALSRGELKSLTAFGDVTRFATGVGGGAVNSYLAAEMKIQESLHTELSRDPNAPASVLTNSHPLCEAVSLIPRSWMREMTYTEERGKPSIAPANPNRPQSNAQNILHQVAEGCYKEINVWDLRAKNSKQATEFDYVPILNALQRRWTTNIRVPSDIDRLRALIDSDVENLLNQKSVACELTLEKHGGDGGKTGGDGGKTGPDGGKTGKIPGKPGKARGKPGSDGGKT